MFKNNEKETPLAYSYKSVAIVVLMLQLRANFALLPRNTNLAFIVKIDPEHRAYV